MPLIHSLRSSSWLAMGCEAHWRASTPTDINDRDPPLPAPICLAAHMQLLKRMSSVCKDALFYASACSYIVGVARSDELRMPPTHTRHTFGRRYLCPIMDGCERVCRKMHPTCTSVPNFGKKGSTVESHPSGICGPFRRLSVCGQPTSWSASQRVSESTSQQVSQSA
eukprot:GHVU01083628.1.p1 GENE.GHVU01083628.1~~GHVU01083628.1.p1  ORF type:complete len:167 (+),score=6.16 GHVU01083628.1:150-650(+)